MLTIRIQGTHIQCCFLLIEIKHSYQKPLRGQLPNRSQSPIIRSHGFSYHSSADDTQLFLSLPPEDTTVSARISDCLADISTWMKNHHLQLNLAKTELMVFPAKQA